MLFRSAEGALNDLSTIPLNFMNIITNICFVAGTLILTDQGEIPIELLNYNNTIRGMKIKMVTKTRSEHMFLTFIQKSAFTEEVPNRDTIVSNNHILFIDDRSDYAEKFVNGKTIRYVTNNVSVLYNVVMDEHSYMYANGIKCETLHPTNNAVILLNAISKNYR